MDNGFVVGFLSFFNSERCGWWVACFVTLLTITGIFGFICKVLGIDEEVNKP